MNFKFTFPFFGKAGTFMLLSFFLLSSEAAVSQWINIHKKQVTLHEAVIIVHSKTGLSVIIVDSAVDKRIDLDEDKASIESIFNRFFEGCQIFYTKNGLNITIEVVRPSPHLSDEFITGQIVGPDKEPLEGAAVSDGHSIRRTNAAGIFHFPTTASLMSLAVQLKGYDSTLAFFSRKDLLVVELMPNAINLNEMVVKGYGRTTRRLSTIGAAGLTATDIRVQGASNVPDALAGHVAGVLVQQVNGVPGSSRSFQLRGKSTIEGGTDMLVVVDGIPLTNGMSGVIGENSAQGEMGTSGLNRIHPSMVANMEVLKDAAATSIFGSRGGNGVLMITMKQGNPGKAKIELENSIGLTRAIQTSPLLNTRQFIQLRKEAALNDGITPDESSLPDVYLPDTTRNTNFTGKVMGKTGLVNNSRISVYGGDTNNLYHFSVAHYQETAVLPGNTHDRRVYAFGSWQHFSKDRRLKLLVSEMDSWEDIHLPVTDATADRYLIPDAPAPRDNSNVYLWKYKGLDIYNLAAQELHTYQGKTTNMLHHLELSFQLPFNFILKGNFGYSIMASEEKTRLPIDAQPPNDNAARTGQTAVISDHARSQIAEITMEYKRSFRCLSLEALGGVTVQEERKDYKDLVIGGYMSDREMDQGNGTGDMRYSQNSVYYRYGAAYGRADLNYSGKYLLTASFRRDGSSRFGPGRQYGNFPAAGAAWIFSEEPWMSRFSWLSFGKLRGSYGITGNDQLGDFRFGETYQTVSGSQGRRLIFPESLFNGKLGWEKNCKAEVSLDLAFFNNRVSFTVAAFRSITDHLLIKENLASQAGASVTMGNQPIGIMNKGVELSLQTQNVVQGAFRWSSAVNFTFLKNVLLHFPGLSVSPYKDRYQEGQSLDVVIGNVFMGVDPGKGVFYFQQANGTVGTGSTEALVKAPGGHFDPDCFGGIENTLHYKSMGLSFFVEYRHQQGRSPYAQVYQEGLPGSQGPYQKSNIPVKMMQAFWRPGSNHALLQRVTAGGNSDAVTAAAAYVASDAAVMDASFLRLRTVSLTYELPQVSCKGHMVNSEVYLHLQNLLTLTSYPMTDPETQQMNALPPLRTVTVGIKMNI
jgi:TonB-linked SusC/RagA family outer membrane protein